MLSRAKFKPAIPQYPELDMSHEDAIAALMLTDEHTRKIARQIRTSPPARGPWTGIETRPRAVLRAAKKSFKASVQAETKRRRIAAKRGTLPAHLCLPSVGADRA